MAIEIDLHGVDQIKAEYGGTINTHWCEVTITDFRGQAIQLNVFAAKGFAKALEHAINSEFNSQQLPEKVA